MSDIILSKEVYETVSIKDHTGKVLSEFAFNPSDANIAVTNSNTLRATPPVLTFSKTRLWLRERVFLICTLRICAV